MRFAVVAAFVVLAGCSTYRDQLGRSEHAFELNDHDRTLALLRDIEPDFARLSPTEQANYAYIRGMTDYNVGYKADARHWLSVANGYETVTPNVLTTERKTKAKAALKELSAVVYNDGTTANLVNARKDEPVVAKPNVVKPGAAKKSAPPMKGSKPAPKPDEPSSDD